MFRLLALLLFGLLSVFSASAQTAADSVFVARPDSLLCTAKPDSLLCTAKPDSLLCIAKPDSLICTATPDSLLTANPEKQFYTDEADTPIYTDEDDALPYIIDKDTIRLRKKKKNFFNSRGYRMTCVGVPLIIGGVIAHGIDKRFRSIRNTYMPHYKCRVDDYIQYAPLVAQFGVKAFGVKGRSSWGRMMVSDVFSSAIMAGVVNTLKYTIKEPRPDGSTNNSFPSGHTATAFMAATMLTKEYGYKSHWVGISSYTLATITGLMRVANNRHWLSDVMTGAGIGILSAELGYFLADLIFKDKGINHEAEDEFLQRLDRPFFLGISLGMNVPLNDYHLDKETVIRTKSGLAASLDGFYFVNPYIGFGGRLSVSKINLHSTEYAIKTSLDILTFCASSHFSYPIAPRLRFDGKLAFGYARYLKLTLGGTTVSARGGLCIGSGASLSYRLRERFGLRIFADYNLLTPYSSASQRYMNTLAFGASAGVIF